MQRLGIAVAVAVLVLVVIIAIVTRPAAGNSTAPTKQPTPCTTNSDCSATSSTPNCVSGNCAPTCVEDSNTCTDPGALYCDSVGNCVATCDANAECAGVSSTAPNCIADSTGATTCAAYCGNDGAAGCASDAPYCSDPTGGGTDGNGTCVAACTSDAQCATADSTAPYCVNSECVATQFSCTGCSSDQTCFGGSPDAPGACVKCYINAAGDSVNCPSGACDTSGAQSSWACTGCVVGESAQNPPGIDAGCAAFAGEPTCTDPGSSSAPCKFCATSSTYIWSDSGTSRTANDGCPGDNPFCDGGSACATCNASSPGSSPNDFGCDAGGAPVCMPGTPNTCVSCYNKNGDTSDPVGCGSGVCNTQTVDSGVCASCYQLAMWAVGEVDPGCTSGDANVCDTTGSAACAVCLPTVTDWATWVSGQNPDRGCAMSGGYKEGPVCNMLNPDAPVCNTCDTTRVVDMPGSIWLQGGVASAHAGCSSTDPVCYATTTSNTDLSCVACGNDHSSGYSVAGVDAGCDAATPWCAATYSNGASSGGCTFCDAGGSAVCGAGLYCSLDGSECVNCYNTYNSDVYVSTTGCGIGDSMTMCNESGTGTNGKPGVCEPSSCTTNEECSAVNLAMPYCYTGECVANCAGGSEVGACTDPSTPYCAGVAGGFGCVACVTSHGQYVSGQFIDEGCQPPTPACLGGVTPSCVACIVGSTNPYCTAGGSCAGTAGDAGTCGNCTIAVAYQGGSQCPHTDDNEQLALGACYAAGGQPGPGACVSCALYPNGVTVGCPSNTDCVDSDDIPVPATGGVGTGCRQSSSINAGGVGGSARELRSTFGH